MIPPRTARFTLRYSLDYQRLAPMPADSVPTDGKRAYLQKLDNNQDPTGEKFRVQFNPESLSVSYNSTLSGTTQEDEAEKQQMGGQSTSMEVDLFFDVTRQTGGDDQDRSKIKDVRELTARVEEFMRPAGEEGQGNGGTGDDNETQPNVRFVWGSFQYDGVITRMKEDLEFFDPEGRPLRATVSISLSGQKPKPSGMEEESNLSGRPEAGESGPDPEEPPPGAENTNGTPLQQLAGEVGAQANWKAIAARNDIDNPRAIHNPGAVDLSARASASASGSASVSGSLSG